jgi:DNA-binding NarL/FixJ family response regulator
MDPTYIRILLIDDQPIVRNGIKTMLEKGDFTDINFSITEANTSSDAKYMLRANSYDIIILDYELSEADGATLCRQILSDYPHIKVLTLSSMNNADIAQEMLKAGARGFVLKTVEAHGLVRAIKTIANGGLYFTENLANALIEKCILGNNLIGIGGDHPAVAKLSKREKEIVGMICDQLTNDQIAKALFLSKRTIDNHRQNILNKLGMVNTAGLVRFAVEHGLVNRA